MKPFVASPDMFNENMGELWGSLHGAVKRSDYQKFTEVGTDEGIAVIKELGVDPEYIYYNPKGIIDRYVYWNGPVYMPLHGGLNPEMLKMMRFPESVAKQEEHMKSLIAANKWTSVFSFMEKKVLITMYMELFDRIPDNQKYMIFEDLYVRSESGFDIFPDDFIKKVFSYKELDPEYPKRMAEFDKNAVKNKNPQGKIKIYHGQNGDYNPNDEMSWTISKKTATFFANRFGNVGKVMSKLITRESVQDYYNSRGEHEVIVFPKRFKS